MKQRQHDEHDSLAMQPWYARDWRASTARAVMSALARGVYRELLDAAWLDGGSLPSEERILQALAGCTPDEWTTVRDDVLSQFKSCEDGRLRQKRLTWQYERAATARERQRQAADATNAKRAAERDAQRDGKRTARRTQPNPKPNPKPNPNPLTEGGEAEGGVSAAASPPAATAPQRNPPDDDGTANGRQEATDLLDSLAALGLDRAAELRAASHMPSRNGHRERWAADVGELSGRWLTVTTAELRKRLAQVAAEREAAAVTSGDEEGDPAAEGTWEPISLDLRAAVGEESWATWLRGLRPVRLEPSGAGPNELVLEAPDEVAVTWIARCYAGPLAAVSDAYGLQLRLTHRGRGGKRGLLLQPPAEEVRP